MHIRLIVLGLLVSILTGCNFQNQIADDPVAYNQSTATARDKVILLNIVRAKDRFPMQFTSVSQVRGSLTGSVGSEFNFPFNGVQDSDFTGKLSGSYQTSPSFDVAVLDSRKFMSGILRPIDLETLKFYWDQGWPRELLAYLFIDKVTFGIDNDGDPVLELRNDPEDSTFKQFQHEVQSLIFSNSIQFNSTSSKAFYGPWLSEKEAKDQFDSLVKAGLGNFKLEENLKNKQYRLYQDKSTLILGPIKPITIANRQIEKFQFPEEESQSSSKTLKIHLRSPQAVMYYLGEIARENLKHEAENKIWRLMPTVKGDPLFNLALAKEPPIDPYLSVEFRDQEFYLPKSSDSDRSLQALALIAQLLALHQESDELPRTNAVEITGG